MSVSHSDRALTLLPALECLMLSVFTCRSTLVNKVETLLVYDSRKNFTLIKSITRKEESSEIPSRFVYLKVITPQIGRAHV